MPTGQTGQLESKPQRQSQVNEQTSNLDKNLSPLHTAIDNIAGRLSAVLRSSVPEAKATEGKDRQELVALADTIEGYNGSVKLAVNKLEDILDRLEL